jgi:hypothetical protein
MGWELGTSGGIRTATTVARVGIGIEPIDFPRTPHEILDVHGSTILGHRSRGGSDVVLTSLSKNQLGITGSGNDAAMAAALQFGDNSSAGSRQWALVNGWNGASGGYGKLFFRQSQQVNIDAVTSGNTIAAFSSAGLAVTGALDVTENVHIGPRGYITSIIMETDVDLPMRFLGVANGAAAFYWIFASITHDDDSDCALRALLVVDRPAQGSANFEWRNIASDSGAGNFACGTTFEILRPAANGSAMDLRARNTNGTAHAWIGLLIIGSVSR